MWTAWRITKDACITHLHCTNFLGPVMSAVITDYTDKNKYLVIPRWTAVINTR